ncbi:hypothetical protein TNCV_2437551 [Trichonephila clavipes]|nr:hypothetical protein TNCV_2437551 [Trichonephila clavipes]
MTYEMTPTHLALTANALRNPLTFPLPATLKQSRACLQTNPPKRRHNFGAKLGDYSPNVALTYLPGNTLPFISRRLRQVGQTKGK